MSLYYEPGTVEVAKGVTNPFSRSEPWETEDEEAKILGQVFTPREVAEVLARWVVSRRPRTVLDPAAGLGHLLHQCRELHPRAQYVGIERDQRTLREAVVSAPTGTKLICADYLRSNGGLFDAIIANPPYVKTQHLDFSEADWRFFEERFGLPLDRLTNLYALFLLKIWEDLAPDGRAAVIIPAEFFNANFGTEIKECLLRRIRPAGIAIFDPTHNVFDDALTTSCILFLEKGRPVQSPILCRAAKSVADVRSFLEDLLSAHASRHEDNGLIDLSAFRPEEKWLNRILGTAREASRQLPRKVGDYFRCLRGIATGANEYFCLTASELGAYGLKRGHLDPCITKAVDGDGLVFTEEKFAALVNGDRRCFLLNPTKPDAAVQAYLRKGEAAGIPQRYLPSHRPVWYLPENREPADVWVAVFSRERVKYILNLAAVKNLTCFHGLYSRRRSREEAVLMTIFLNSSFGRESFFAVNRFYGDGLNKLEPKDVEAMPCPELPALDSARVKCIRKKLLDIDTLPTSERQKVIDTLMNDVFRREVVDASKLNSRFADSRDLLPLPRLA